VKRAFSFFSVGALGLAASFRFSPAAELPFYIVNPESEWEVQTVNKNLGKDLICDRLITHLGSAERMFVLSHPASSAETEPLATFADQIENSFHGFQIVAATKKHASEFGFDGMESHFELLREKENLDCVLFVFTLQPTHWGVLYCKPKESSSSVGVAFSLLQRKTPDAPELVGMKPFRVHDAALSDFPISFKVQGSPSSDRVQAITITEVARDSVLEKEGVKIGDQIVEIDGKKVTDFSARVGKDSELGRIFLNRNSGDEVELEIVSVRSHRPIHVKLRASNFLNHILPR